MKIAVLGTRGFPNVQGGVEAHCQRLYPRLVKMGCETTVFTREPYINIQIKKYKGVNFIPLDCPKSKHFEAMYHTFKGIFAAKRIKPDILQIHAIGPSLLAPLARILGLKVVVTNHGPDYKREKWSRFAKSVLKLGERIGSYYANEVICISRNIADNIKRKYNRDSHIIPNGVKIPEVLKSEEILKKLSLKKQKYVLSVGRLVPEKGADDLIEAFSQAGLKDWKLVITGKSYHEDKYSRELKEKNGKNKNIVLTGYLNGKALEELYSHAGMFVLPSHYEGLPIVLLEALSYGLLCLASDIPGNLCVRLPEENYFSTGDIRQLAEKLRKFTKVSLSAIQKSAQIELLRKSYDWDLIARRTLAVYKKALNKQRKSI